MVLPSQVSSGLSRVSLKPANRLKRHKVHGQPLSYWLTSFFIGLPEIMGGPICLEVLPELRAYRGELLSGGRAIRGNAVHAASFLRERRIVVEDALLNNAASLRYILIHELFHFVWWRLGNASRREFDTLIRNEVRVGIKGELGESSGVAKAKLQAGDCEESNPRWKNYVCESFCDTAAWLYGDRTITALVTLPRTPISKRGFWLGAQTGLRA
jgi:hypothetical protein